MPPTETPLTVKPPPVFIFRHSPDESAGTLGECLAAAGLDYRYLTLSDEALPEFRPELASGLVILGGAMNCDEVAEFPFLAAEPEWIRQAVAADWPVLGICLGAQLLALAHGARVGRNPVKEIGWYRLALEPAAVGDALFRGQGGSPHVFQWHGDTFDWPSGATPLARGDTCPRQAYRLGQRAYGLQFHLEVDEAIIDRWLSEPAGVCELAAAEYLDPGEIRRQTPGYLPPMRAMAREVFGRFAELVRDASSGG